MIDRFSVVCITIAAVTILFEGWTLGKTLKCHEHKDIIKIIVMLISSSLMLLVFFCFDQEVDQGNFEHPLTLSLTLGIGFSFFNLGHWMFVYEYYNLVKIMPYVYDNKKVPRHILQRNKI